MTRRNGNLPRIKRWVGGSLLAVLVVDAGLGVFVWRAAAMHPQEERRNLERLRERHRKFGLEVRRAEEIRERLPDVERDGNRFYGAQFLSSATGYSTTVADLGEIAAKAGLPVSNIGFKQREVEKRDVVEVDVNATIEGEYPALVRFVNGLERSDHFYLLDTLSLASGAERRIRLNLGMRTYFRSQK